MTRPVLILWLTSIASLVAAEHPDLLRFTNGDQLHGTFIGIKDGPQVVWQRGDMDAPVDFKTASIRHIILHGGRPIRALESLSHIGLVNGDRIPGIITAIDDEQITLDSACAGMVSIPRGQVSILSPNPLGGRVYYHGPFAEDDWKMKHPAFPGVLPDAVPADKKMSRDKDEVSDEEDVKDEEDAAGRWTFSGSAWYWQEKIAGTALIYENGLPDRAVLTFDLAWKNRLNLAIGFHADFAPANADDEDDKGNRKGRSLTYRGTSDLPLIFGNSHVLQLSSSYLTLFRTSLNKNGKTSLERVQTNHVSVRLGDTGNAKFEIRSKRSSGEISLFIDDEFVTQWNESKIPPDEGTISAGNNSGLGFVVHANDSPVRISDIIISEWNGMPDSARSLQVDDQDVVLMTNGTDRYAGKVGKLDEDGKVLFEGKHGNFRFPLEDVAEIRFAREQLATPEDAPADNVLVRFNPIGSISGQPISGKETTLGILSPIIGKLNLSLDSAVMLDFNDSNQFINDWDVDF